MNINFENISKIYNGKEILKNIGGKIFKGEKIGLIGSNGIGKSTLVKIIAGLEALDGGKINYIPAKEPIAFLNQNFSESAAKELTDKTIQDIVYKSKISEESSLKAILLDLGLTDKKLDRPLLSFSGGEQTKLMLVKFFLEEADFFIMDEPTNHLDIESKAVLQKLVNKFKKTMLIISHDRYFLDNTVNKIWEMTSKGIKEYAGNYSAYKEQKAIALKNQLKEYDKQQKTIFHLEEVINERKEWFIKAHAAAGQNDALRAKAKKQISIMRSKEKQLKRLEANKVDIPREEKSPCFDIINKNILNLKLPRYIIRVKALNKNYDKKPIFKEASFNILKGDKIGILGKNGSGKTTLLRILAGLDSDFQGEVNINPSIRTAYFSQQLEVLDYSKNILENLLSEGADKADARNLLASLLFKGEDVFKSAKVLSMGERCRLAIAKLILSGANLLILDEPTNYLDIVSKEKIEDTLRQFQGSIIFVSHDIYFLNSIANKIIEIKNKNISAYPGDYKFYQEKTKEASNIKNQAQTRQSIKTEIIRLECELAFLGGKFNEKLEEEEKKALEEEFLNKAKELKLYRSKL